MCLHLPDYSSSSVASVLSLLYYGEQKAKDSQEINTAEGETWLGFEDSQARSNINSLLCSLGVPLEVWQSPFGPSLRRVPLPNTDAGSVL